MSLSEELAYMSAAELASRIRRRELSPVDVVEACIERIEQRDKSLNAFVYRGFDDARKNAKEAERALMSGEELGILHGVPTAMKDLFDFRPGWVATFGGVKAFQDNVSDFYSNYPERIEKAGAVLLGKTNSPVMGFRGTCDNYLFGPTRNPFDLSRNSGGSSGGSAAAVADGMVPIAQGSDGGGSVRIPAAWCGLYGFKASFGRAPMVLRPNAFGGTAPFVFEGTLTRTVEDAALGLTAITGYNSRDPYSLDQAIDYMGALRGSVKGWKIAYSPDLDVYPVDKRVAETVANAVKVFEAAGAHVEEVKLGLTRDQRELSDLWCRMIMPLSIETFETFKQQGLDLLADHREDFPPQFLEWFEKCSRMTVHDLIRDQQIRTEVYDAVQNVLDDYQLLITPTLAAMPVENTDDGNTTGPTQINGVEVDPLIGWCMTYFINYTGHPAASIPAGLADGLPVGMQIIGRRYADTDVLTASSVFERINPWQDIYKLCAARPL
ncbi:amidase [Brevibacillus sp. B_LB10_24]|uniref:amidase n=1 Tax=Brevibacillus sp. B_LB10_24 TaxID=3380645 RepID=UPI0038BA26EF